MGRLCELVHLPDGRLIVSWVGLLVRKVRMKTLSLPACPGSPYCPPLPAFSQFFHLFLLMPCVSPSLPLTLSGEWTPSLPLSIHVSTPSIFSTPLLLASLRFENFPVQTEPLTSDEKKMASGKDPESSRLSVLNSLFFPDFFSPSLKSHFHPLLRHRPAQGGPTHPLATKFPVHVPGTP